MSDPSPLPGPIAPHGGVLVDRVLTGEARARGLERAATLPALSLDAVGTADLELIATGATSPLTGFMDAATYASVVEAMRLPTGVVWPMPIVLPVGEDAPVTVGAEHALRAPGGALVGLIAVSEVFTRDVEREAALVYGTTDRTHPGVARMHARGRRLVAGEVWLLAEHPGGSAWAGYPATPRATRAAIAARGWQRVVGFQTRNPVHRAHEHVQKCALEFVDGLLLHPLVGETREGDVPAELRMRAYELVIAHYFPAERVLLGVFPAAMRYAGPREALFHALCRKNYGCTHFIVGRDHAGVGDTYGAYEAQAIFDRFPAEAIGIEPLRFTSAFYCRRCDGMASERTCPHAQAEHVTLSGTRVRAMVRAGERPPPEITRPELADLLLRELGPAIASEDGG